ncbi:ATP-binding cassette domain-containing protein [Aestuariirhabdus litorea]|uniref:ABC transporter ATP-binding protein n=1 Tax=Aestuariirhabdus litorea TaxID=2528527 RepID=A0A3P3VKV0_9GAMM|nr:ABC transporter ATP-binding protein [Aestuariirhabdus litorea]RRJ83320.1 ABC transporter ATP-binding protein [Aestuariirhabdus litorea]RWW93480.1 ATP-binding cassette domain-containing protein [Endozoicomonadaceae bacterium GTF-13]
MKLPPLLSGHRRWYFAALLGNGLLQALLAIATALLVKQGFDQWIGATSESPGPSGAGLVATLGLILLGNALLRWRGHLDAERIGQSYVHQVRQRLFRHLTRLGSERLQGFSRGALMLRFVGDLSAMRNWISLGLARLALSGLSIFIALGVLAWIQPLISLSVATASLLATGIALAMGPAIRARNRTARQRRGRLAANLNDRVTHLKVVTGFGQQRREQRRFNRHSRQLQGALVSRAGLTGLLRALSEATAGLASLCTLLTGAWLLEAGLATPGSLVAAMVVTGLLAPGLQEMGRVYEYWNNYRIAREKQQRLLRLRAPRQSHRHPLTSLPDGAGVIELQGVAFGDRLQPLDLRLLPGEPCCLLGANGAGKSTLLRLIAGQLRPDQGRVLLDGVDLSRLPAEARARGCILVSPELPLLRGSLRYNLCYGLNPFEPKALERVIRQCRLQDLIARLPHQLDTRLSDQQPLLSSGEIARVLLARALLAQPRVLLLDEADAYLDPVAREVLIDTLRKFRGTLVFSTHNPAMARYARHHLRLQEGQLCCDQGLAPAALMSVSPPGIRPVPVPLSTVKRNTP